MKTDATRHEENLTPPFPFVGAGAAQYFEWAELFVRFERAPSAGERRKIAAGVPSPIADVKWDEAVLWVSSEQGVGRQISAAYGPKARLPAELTHTNRFHAAAGDKVARFNAHIETWLVATHAVTPILVAVRRQDWEAGGTKLSAWHEASLTAIAPALKAMAASPSALDLDVGKRLVAAAEDAKVKLPAKLFRALESKCKPLVEAKEAAEAKSDEENEAAVNAQYEAALAVPKTYDLKKLPVADEAAVKAALDSLAKALPKLARVLRKLPPGRRALRPGASKASLDAAEKALGRKLTAAHRALLTAFDGGTVGELVLLGTETSGARGRDSLVTFARALELHGFNENPVVRYEDKKYGDSFVHTHKAEGAQQISYLIEYTRRSPKLDNLLADLAKEGKMTGSWS